MKVGRPHIRPWWRRTGGFTVSLVEVVITAALSAIILSALILAYLQCSQRTEWSAYSLAAQGLAMKRLEAVRAARWDTLAYPITAENNQVVISNFPNSVEVLDIPVGPGGSNVTVSLTLAITDISITPPLKQISVQCVWPFYNRLFTNTIVTYRAPDQ